MTEEKIQDRLGNIQIGWVLFFRERPNPIRDPQFTAFLTELEKKAAEKPSNLAALLSWMAKNNLSLLALDYAKSLPPETLRNWPVPLALVAGKQDGELGRQ